MVGVQDQLPAVYGVNASQVRSDDRQPTFTSILTTRGQAVKSGNLRCDAHTGFWLEDGAC
ncbi:hypothetical protein CTA2_785 [Colletotrichum tanaceti]|nr:hypothetical protein CTA2_785 [Colletotrichum tanaceti]